MILLALIFQQLLSQHTSKYLEYQWFKNQRQQVDRLKVNQPLSVLLTDWQGSWVESESESNFICLLSEPHVSWPMTHHPAAVIFRCCDLALPQSHSRLLTSSCRGLRLDKKNKSDSFFFLFKNDVRNIFIHNVATNHISPNIFVNIWAMRSRDHRRDYSILSTTSRLSYLFVRAHYSTVFPILVIPFSSPLTITATRVVLSPVTGRKSIGLAASYISDVT